MTDKTEQNKINRINKYINDLSTEFTKTPNDNLFCILCNKIVKSERKFLIESHLSSASHINKRIKCVDQTTGIIKKGSSVQTFLDTTNKKVEFSKLLIKTFLAIDIPIYKFRLKKLKNLFNYMGHPLPSETTIRQGVNELYNENIIFIKSQLLSKKIFLIIDETTANGKSYTNILMGSIETPHKSYLVYCDINKSSINGEYTFALIKKVLMEFDISKENFLILISDSAPYMIYASGKLKEMFLNMFHISCIAHLYHNIASKIALHYTEVNNLIAAIKASISKNNARKNMFLKIGLPPNAITIRWGSWLTTAKYYSKNFNSVKSIVNNFEDDGIIVENAKIAINNTSVKSQLLELELKYFFLIDLINRACRVDYTIEKALSDIESIYIDNDFLDLKSYINKRLKKNDILNIKSMSNERLNPETYCFLLKSQATSVQVERSFSILNKFNAKDRNFNDENFSKNLILHYNLIEEEESETKTQE
ncbi:MAG: hypothetical protein ACRC0V_07510 [Fusobacteriaceae bacterium]